MKNILVAGIGSPFGADQLGWQVVDLLQSGQHDAGDPSADCDFIKLDRPGSGLLAHFKGYARVVLIDAVQAGKPRATLIRLDAEQISEQAAGLSSHNFGVAEAVALARAMGELPQELVLYGLDAGEKPEVVLEADAIGKLIERVVLEVSEAVSG